MNTTILIIATLFTGLMAGLFYAWSISVTPGLGQVEDVHYLHSFQSMNRAILNPAFFIPFIGLVFILPIVTYLYYKVGINIQFWYILIATLLYLFGVIAVTFMGNVPLNNLLEALSIEAMSADQMESFRVGFENKWNQLNMIRTISSFLSLIFLVLACISQSK